MHDQLLNLREKGINTCYINSLLSSEQRESVIANLYRSDSEYKIVLVSPEVLLSQSLHSLMVELKSQGCLNFFAVDEAHCIDTWGVDFRPEYQEFGRLKNYGVPVVALTGTATSVTLNQIQETLRLTDAKYVQLPFRRDNLVFEVVPKKSGVSAALKQVAELITSRFSFCLI